MCGLNFFILFMVLYNVVPEITTSSIMIILLNFCQSICESITRSDITSPRNVINDSFSKTEIKQAAFLAIIIYKSA